MRPAWGDGEGQDLKVNRVIGIALVHDGADIVNVATGRNRVKAIRGNQDPVNPGNHQDAIAHFVVSPLDMPCHI